MRGHKQGHYPLQEGLGGLVVAEQLVAVDVAQLADLGGGAAGGDARHAGIQAQQAVKPALHRVLAGVANRLLQRDLLQLATCP